MKATIGAHIPAGCQLHLISLYHVFVCVSGSMSVLDRGEVGCHRRQALYKREGLRTVRMHTDSWRGNGAALGTMFRYF